MRSIVKVVRIGLISCFSLSLVAPMASAQKQPEVVEPKPPQVIDPTGGNNNEPQPDNSTVAAASRVEVKCEGLSSVVRKGDRQAVMMKWNSGFFGKEYTPEKRCSLVSERLQKAADLNGGTFKGLELASGTLNAQAVICVVKNGGSRCNKDNLLFTLKPENAKNPNAVIQKIMTFAEDGSAAVEESASRQPRFDRNLGNWEKKVFPNQPKSRSHKGF
jgi:hypothetical protein